MIKTRSRLAADWFSQLRQHSTTQEAEIPALTTLKEVITTPETWTIDIAGVAHRSEGLLTARDISLTGSVSGTTSFDGTSNVSLDTVVNPPLIFTVTPTEYTGQAGTEVHIYGEKFTATSVVKFIDATGKSFTAGSSTFIDATHLVATTPQNFTVAQEPLSISVTSSGFVALKENVLDTGSVPIWSSPAGTLATLGVNESVSTQLQVTNNDSSFGDVVTFTVLSGALPPGISLSSSGLLSGVADFTSDAVYTFTVRATDLGGNTTDREFSYTLLVASPSWQTASGSLGSDYTERASSFSASATPEVGTLSSYSVVSGSIPPGMSLDSSTGVISGTASGVADFSATTFNFVLRATNSYGKTADRSFSIYIASRYEGYSCYTTSEGGCFTVNAPSGKVFNRRDFSSYGTPNGGCGGYTYSGCHAGSSYSWWDGVLPTTSRQWCAAHTWWGDPCGGTYKRGYVQLSYGVF